MKTFQTFYTGAKLNKSFIKTNWSGLYGWSSVFDDLMTWSLKQSLVLLYFISLYTEEADQVSQVNALTVVFACRLRWRRRWGQVVHLWWSGSWFLWDTLFGEVNNPAQTHSGALMLVSCRLEDHHPPGITPQVLHMLKVNAYKHGWINHHNMCEILIWTQCIRNSRRSYRLFSFNISIGVNKMPHQSCCGVVKILISCLYFCWLHTRNNAEFEITYFLGNLVVFVAKPRHFNL